MNISVIQNFELKGKLLGHLQLPKSEIKFFTSLWRSLLNCFVKACPLENDLSDYLTETAVMILFLKAETWFLCSRTE